MNHPDIELLLADYRGLRGSERDAVDAHVATCASCASRLAEYREMDATLQGLPDPRPDERLRTGYFATVKGESSSQSIRTSADHQPAPWLPDFAAVAATAFVVLAIIWIARGSGRTGVEETAGPAAVPPASTAFTEIIFQCEGITEWPDLSRVISDFEAANPDVKVKFTPVHIFGTDEASYDTAVKHAAETADVYCAMPSPTHMQMGVARDLTTFITADASFRPDDFYPGLLFRWGEATGPILAVPTYFRPNLIAYDPAAFDKADMPYPQPGWTWDDFLTAAAQLTTRQGNEIVRWGYSEVGTGLINGRLWSEWSADWQAGPSYAALADALAWYETLYIKAKAAPAPITLGWEGGKTYTIDEDLRQYSNGTKSAMWDVTWGEAVKTDHLAPYPETRTTEPHTLMSTLTGLVLSGQTAHPDASWRWISYLSQHLPDSENLQARRSLAEHASIWARLDPASTAAYRYALDHLTDFPRKTPAEYATQMEAVVAVVKGEKTAAQALADLVAQGQVRGAPGTPAPEQTVIVTMATATPQPAAVTPPAGATVITFACYRDRLPIYAPAVEVFQAANPGVYVELKALEDLGVTQEAASMQPGAFEAAAAQVDTLCDDTLPGKIRAGVAEQALRDLSPFIAADAAFDAADFYPGALEMLQAGARTWGIPRGLRLQLIYTSQYAFDQAGVSYPAPGWTWDDFLRTAKALTLTQANGNTRWGFRENWSAQFGLLRAHGLPPLDGGLNGLTTPEAQAALQWYVDLVRLHQVMPAPAMYTDAAQSGVSAAANPWADTAMFAGLANGVVADSKNLASRIGVAPFPVGVNSRTTPLEQIGDAIAMSAATQHPEESWRWLAVASRAAGYYERMVPARRSRFEAGASLTGVDPTVQSIYRYALEHLAPPLDGDPAVSQALQEAIRAALADGQPVDQALREAVRQ